MNDDTRDRALREATAGLCRAVRALEDAGYYDLSTQAFGVANGVLRARQALIRRPAGLRPAIEILEVTLP